MRRKQISSQRQELRGILGTLHNVAIVAQYELWVGVAGMRGVGPLVWNLGLELLVDMKHSSLQSPIKNLGSRIVKGIQPRMPSITYPESVLEASI